MVDECAARNDAAANSNAAATRVCYASRTSHVTQPLQLPEAEYVDAPPPVQVAPIEPDNGAFFKAILGGLVGLVIGAVVYALFVGLTHFEIGYLAIGVGFVVAKGMNIASHERGGRAYQVAAVILTYLSVGCAFSLLAWWNLHSGGQTVGVGAVLGLGIVALVFPYFELSGNVGSGLIGLFILFIGMRAAWRMTSGNSNEAHHPFSR